MGPIATTESTTQGRVIGCPWAVVAVGAALIASGCAGGSSLSLTGTLMGVAGDGKLVSYDLKADSVQEYGGTEYGHTAFHCGLGGRLGPAVALSRASEAPGDSVPYVWLVTATGGSSRRIGVGLCPTVSVTDSCIVCYGAGRHVAGTLPLLCYRPGEGTAPESLWNVGVFLSGTGWASNLRAPVEVEPGRFAVVGPDGGVWTVEVATGTHRRLGMEGRIPAFWQGSRHALVCYDPHADMYEAFRLDGRMIGPLPELRELVAVAPGTRQDVTLFVGPRRVGGWRTEDYSLKAYSWQSKKVSVVREFMPFLMGRMIWVE